LSVKKNLLIALLKKVKYFYFNRKNTVREIKQILRMILISFLKKEKKNSYDETSFNGFYVFCAYI